MVVGNTPDLTARFVTGLLHMCLSTLQKISANSMPKSFNFIFDHFQVCSYYSYHTAVHNPLKQTVKCLFVYKHFVKKMPVKKKLEML